MKNKSNQKTNKQQKNQEQRQNKVQKNNLFDEEYMEELEPEIDQLELQKEEIRKSSSTSKHHRKSKNETA